MSHVVEEESGTFAPRTPHPHNGYYAGDFSTVPFHLPEPGVLRGINETAA